MVMKTNPMFRFFAGIQVICVLLSGLAYPEDWRSSLRLTPVLGAATLDATAVPTGPSLEPIKTLICAAFGPRLTKASPIYMA